MGELSTRYLSQFWASLTLSLIDTFQDEKIWLSHIKLLRYFLQGRISLMLQIYRKHIHWGKYTSWHDKEINKSINKYNHHEKYFKVPMITLPYIKGTTDSLTEILKIRGSMVSFPPLNSIRCLVDSAKLC